MSAARSFRPLRISRRHFSRPQARSLSISAESSATAAPETGSPHDVLVHQKLDHLRTALSQERHHPNRIWAYYLSAASLVGYSNLPLDIHKQVLRKCTPSAANVRAAAMRRFAQGLRPLAPHIHEGRFQAIVRHIRALGQKPDIADYNFVLEQFAATGHHTGSIMVFKELRRLDVVPDAKTYGLVLQALARRLALPCHFLARPRLVNQTRKMLGDLLADMQATQTTMAGVNVDLTLRILKETMDVEGFETLTKLMYGIDLQNPDRPVLVQAESVEKGASAVSPMFADLAPAQPLPFTTAALNTTLDMLGRFGDVAKLVQAFEVLTTPLPPKTSANFFSSQYDDEDDDWGFTQRPGGPNDASASPPSPPQPYAKANTTSYAILIRHLAQLNHPVFVRHYLKQAMALDWSVRGALRRSVRTQPLDQIQPPSFAITKNMFLSAHGLANREKMLSLSRWLDSKIPKLIRMKTKDLAFYKQKLEELEVDEDAAEGSLSSRTVTVAPKASGSSTTEASASSSRSALRHFPELDIPLSEEASSGTSASSSTPKTFSLPLHVSILKRDITEMTNFYQYHTQILGRNTQRLKEKLGRRVWRGQNVYLAGVDARKKMSKTQWGDIVNFRERKNVIVGDRDKRKVAPGQPGPFIKPRWLEAQLGRFGGLGTSSRMDRL